MKTGNACLALVVNKEKKFSTLHSWSQVQINHGIEIIPLPLDRMDVTAPPGKKLGFGSLSGTVLGSFPLFTSQLKA